MPVSEPPLAADPPPGWYPNPDPDSRSDYRWWDGSSWTDATADDATLRNETQGNETSGAEVSDAERPSYEHQAASQLIVDAAPPESTSVFGPVGAWVAESFRLTISRFGHLLPVVLFFVLLVSLVISFGVWFAFRDTIVVFDPETATPEITYGGSMAALIVVAILIPVATALSFPAKGAAIRQAWTVTTGNPEPWSTSVLAAIKNRRLILGLAVRTLIYWGLGALFVLAVVPVSYTHLPSPRDATLSRMPSSA